MNKVFKILTVFFILLFLTSCTNTNDNSDEFDDDWDEEVDEYIDWSAGMYNIGDNVGSYDQTNMQIVIRSAQVENVDGQDRLLLLTTMTNNTLFYIQLYNGNFNVYDHSLGRDALPLTIYGMSSGYGY